MSAPLHRQGLAACLSTRRTSLVEARWMVSLADVLAVCLCALVLQYALTAAPPAARDSALFGVRSAFGTGDAVTPRETAQPTGSNLSYWAGWFARRVAQEPLLSDIDVRAGVHRIGLTLPADVMASPSRVRSLAQLLALSGQPVRILWQNTRQLEAALELQQRMGGSADAVDIDLMWTSHLLPDADIQLEIGA